MDLSEKSDEELLELAKSGTMGERVFFEWVRRYKKRIYFHVHRILQNHEDADDATQLTFIKLYKHINQFESRSGLYTWLYTIASREAYGILRRNNKRSDKRVNLDETRNTLFSSEYMNGNEVSFKLWNAVNNLPLKQKEVFNLKYYDELSYDEIAKITGTSVGALKASYHHAVKKIKDLFDL